MHAPQADRLRDYTQKINGIEIKTLIFKLYNYILLFYLCFQNY